MGCFGYICKGCGTPINGSCMTGGEKCIMIHVRNGEEIGRVEGHYDEYGRVMEQDDLPEDEKYRGYSDGANGHSEICRSEFELEDSFFRLEGMRLYNGKEVSYMDYIRMGMSKPIGGELFSLLNETQKNEIISILGTSHVKAELLARQYIREKMEHSHEYERQFAALPPIKRKTYSGTVAWHSLCYHRASDTARADLTPSHSDPDQSWGEIRKKYR